MKLGTALTGAALGILTISGLSLGLSLESQKKAVYDSRISELREELGVASAIRQELNIVPPNGKGFIN